MTYSHKFYSVRNSGLNHVRQQDVPHTHHGSDTEGSLYLPDPDGIVIEITTAGIVD